MPEYTPYSPPYLEEEESRRTGEYLNIELNKISGEFFKLPPSTISGLESTTPDTPGRTIGTSPEKVLFTGDYNLGIHAIHADHTTDDITLALGGYQAVVEMVFTVEFICASKTNYTFVLYVNGVASNILFKVGTSNGQDYASSSITKAFQVQGDSVLEIYVYAEASGKAFEIQSVDTYLKVLAI